MSIYLGDKKLAGSVKLYSGTGQNTDGAMTQKATTDELNKKLGSNQITNCITHIPQDILVEINDSNGLTLKSGSKLYQPNGNGIFTPVAISGNKSRNDLSVFSSGTYLVFRSTGQYTSNGGLIAFAVNMCVSGSTDPIGGPNTHVWYDTNNNVIKTYKIGTYEYTDLSLPIAVVTITNGTGVTSIDQVFNGLGYIGSTVFALPGVRGLIPNGRNEDGTLKNTAFEISSVKTNTSGVSANYTVGLSRTAILLDSAASYSEQENYNGGSSRNYAFVGSLTNTSGVISNFHIKTTFHTLDYNDSEYIAHQAMPNEVRRIGNIFASTITTTLQSYTAPADGYISVIGKSDSGMICNFNINGVRVAAFGGSNSTSQVYGSVFFAIKKGAVVSAQTNSLQVTQISSLFIYAEGVA